jgi:hypothetical protein
MITNIIWGFKMLDAIANSLTIVSSTKKRVDSMTDEC